MKTQQTKTLTPQTASTDAEILKLRRDNISAGDFSMLVEKGEVHLFGPGAGEVNRISIPKLIFDQFVEMYRNG